MLRCVVTLDASEEITETCAVENVISVVEAQAMVEVTVAVASAEGCEMMKNLRGILLKINDKIALQKSLLH